MDDTPTEEPQHLFGMQIEPGHAFPRVDPTEQRVLGIPRSWYRTTTVDYSGFRHPIRWTKWRIRCHRLGPYAPDYKKSIAGPEKAKP
ncbi:hypothetical protein [Mycobacterium sp.]|uniref:hypothetical protein n=1 Tax=Mycobacterium sp. TaxID=1785 RepID=UPI003BB1CEB2